MPKPRLRYVVLLGHPVAHSRSPVMQQAAFDAANPQIALWVKIRTALLEADGEQYFETGLKGRAVPQLSGRLVEAKPACNPRELMIAVPTPDAPEPSRAEIQVRLASPLRGKAELGQSIRWQGMPVAFSKEPFLLRMTSEAAGIEGVKLTPCGSKVRP